MNALTGAGALVTTGDGAAATGARGAGAAIGAAGRAGLAIFGASPVVLEAAVTDLGPDFGEAAGGVAGAGDEEVLVDFFIRGNGCGFT